MDARQPRIALDLLRGLASVAVFVGHVRGSAFVEYGALPASQHNPVTAAFFALTRLGSEAVLVFFVLSGLLVGGQIIERVRNGRFDLPGYATGRLTRIFIPLVPALVLTIAINAIVFREAPNLYQVLAHVLGLNGVLAPALERNAPLWSLAYEIWFYVAGGALGWMFSRRKGSAMALGVLAVSAIAFSVLEARFFLYWSMGALTSIAVSNVRRPFWPACLGAVLFLAGLAFHQLGTTSRSVTSSVIVEPPVAEALVCVGLCLMLPALCSQTLNQRLGGLRSLAARLGAISYTLYLVHNPVNATMDLAFAEPRMGALSPLSVSIFMLRLLVCLGVAVIFYCLFERNTAAARRYLVRLYGDRRPVRRPTDPIANPDRAGSA